MSSLSRTLSKTLSKNKDSSSDDKESSSVEVVAARDARGRGKGIRVVSDGV